MFAHWSRRNREHAGRPPRTGCAGRSARRDRRVQSGGVDSSLRSSRGRISIRSASPNRSAIRRSNPVARSDRGGARAAAGVGRRREPRRRARPPRSTPSRGCAPSTAARPATTTTTCSCRKSATGCARRSRRAATGRRSIRSTARSCSIASPQVETFERFLHRTFPGKTRFSIEGLDLMIPILDEIIHDAADGGVQHVMIAMAHRGRLNVLAHVLQKPYAQVLAEFKDPLVRPIGPHRSRLDGRREVSRRRALCGRERRPAANRWSSACRPIRAISRPWIPCSPAWRARRPAPVDRPGAPALEAGEGAGHPHSRRRGVPRPGRRRRDAEPVAARRLRGRRHHPHHRQQPAWASPPSRTSRSAPATPAASPAASRFRSCTSTPTIRSRASRRRAWRGPTGRRFEPRLPDRSRRLPPLRPQRGRRAGVHAAASSISASRTIRPCASGTRTQLAAARRGLRGRRRTRWSSGRCARSKRRTRRSSPSRTTSRHCRRCRRAAPRCARRPPCRSIGSRALNRALMTRARRLHGASQARTGPRAAPQLPRPAGRAHRSTGRPAEELAFASILEDGIADSADRRGRRARHVQPAPRGAARRGHRRRAHAARRAAQARARRSRSTTARSPRTRPIGFEFGYNIQEPRRLVVWEGAVRRLHQRRAGRARRVPHVRTREVGTDAVAGASAAARLRGAGARSLERPARAVPAVRRRHQHAHRQLHDRRAVLPPAAAPGAAARHRSAAARRS